MQAMIIRSYGGPDAFEAAEVPTPRPGRGEVLVRVRGSSVNPIDVKTRAGRGTAAAIAGFPIVLGHDFAGVVEQVPYAAHPLQPGDRVYGMGRAPRTGGSFAEFISVSSMSVAPMPASLDFAHAAAVPLAALTAWGAVVDTARVHDGQRVLVHAGAGGVGHFAVQFAAYFGAVVTTTQRARASVFDSTIGSVGTSEGSLRSFARGGSRPARR